WTGPPETRDDVAGIDLLCALTADARPDPEQTVGRLVLQRAVVRDAVREDVAHGDFERDGEDVEAREDVFARRPPRARDSAQIVRIQVDQVEDALLVELIGIVELAGDDPCAIRQRVNEAVDEGLIVETHLTAARVSRVVPLEGTETVD